MLPAQVWENTHMHLRSAAAQQVDKGRVEGHDGVPHVNEVIIIVLKDISVTGNNRNGQLLVMNQKQIVTDNKQHQSIDFPI